MSSTTPAAEVGKNLLDMFDGKPHVVTEADMSRPWSSYADGRLFRCYLCGTFFKPGDRLRFVWCNGVHEAREAGAHCGNVFVCAACDGPDIYPRLAAHEQLGKQRHWHLMDPARLPRNPHSPPVRKRR